MTVAPDVGNQLRRRVLAPNKEDGILNLVCQHAEYFFLSPGETEEIAKGVSASKNIESHRKGWIGFQRSYDSGLNWVLVIARCILVTVVRATIFFQLGRGDLGSPERWSSWYSPVSFLVSPRGAGKFLLTWYQDLRAVCRSVNPTERSDRL